MSDNNIAGSAGVKVYEVAYDTLLLTIFLLCEVIQHKMDYDPAITRNAIKAYTASFFGGGVGYGWLSVSSLNQLEDNHGKDTTQKAFTHSDSFLEAVGKLPV